MDGLTITMSVERYEQLLDLETRVNVLVDHICNEEWVKMESVLRMLGTAQAIDKADELKKEKMTENKMEF